ncbi:MAG: NAD-dependent epimerase/dehydratase family protein [Actinomycetota bacterium]|nr:NAD-dependent epimerase/dehydratase family protein [Actinomycetota bacterium]
MDRALVTGGAGFIGSHLAELLLDDGWEVFVLDDLSTGSVRNVERLTGRREFHLTVESVLSPSVVSELVHKCDVVFHLAAAVGVRLIVERPGHTLLTNVRGTENVLEYASRFGKPVLVASSSEVYGDHPGENLPLAEGARRIYGPTTAKRWAYADSKAMDEFLALARHEEEGLRCVIARLFNTVGPGQSGQYGNVIPRFVQNALADAPLEIHGDGSQTRCFCHVEDTVRALVGLMTAPHTAGEIYNVGSTEVVTILELAERVIRATGSTSELVFVPYEEVYGHGIEEMFQRIPSIEKIRAAIGWRPTVDLDGILAAVIAHSSASAAEPVPAAREPRLGR